jgi:hypothetical protein
MNVSPGRRWRRGRCGCRFLRAELTPNSRRVIDWSMVNSGSLHERVRRLIQAIRVELCCRIAQKFHTSSGLEILISDAQSTRNWTFGWTVPEHTQYIANSATESSGLTTTLVYHEALIGFVGEVLTKIRGPPRLRRCGSKILTTR